MPPLGWLSAGAAVIVAGAAGWIAARLKRDSATTIEAHTGEIPAQGGRVRALMSHTPARRRLSTQGALSDLRGEVQRGVELREAEQDLGVLTRTLADVRDAFGAEEAVLWRWLEQRDSLQPAAWSTLQAERPRHFRLDEWAPLLRWSAEERVVQCDADEGSVHVVAAPLVVQERLFGVLSVSSASGLLMGRADVREWGQRYAKQVETLLEMFELRREYGRHMRQSSALLGAVQRIQSHTTHEALSRAICETALEVTSASASALVRWYPDRNEGEVQATSAGMSVKGATVVSPDSLTAGACRDGLPVVIEDAVLMHASASLLVKGDHASSCGSLAVMPLGRDGRTLGAIVITSPTGGAITAEEARNVSVLGAVAAASLEIVWEIEEVTQRSRTDALTGLRNRRDFDVQLERLLSESDRFGQPVSLIICDVDHFKAVNDGHGHEAGDAVLRRVAKILQDGVRTVDVCARYGGEEIAMLLPQTSTQGAVELADRLRRAIAQHPLEWQGTAVAVTASFGVACYPETARGRDSLFPSADRALYEAKSAGRNCVKSAGSTPDRASS
ncbi:MAG: hypothetical protein JWO05_3154 [Gemmatimonadetes bacterium]|nr:hypothetical protein [Gemmatimonadota bacterium]